MNVKTDITQLIGKTPLLELCGIEKEKKTIGKLLAKLEYFNPAGSIKDRVAANIIENAEESGELCAGSVIIEPTSGNTGIGIAAVAAVKGYKTIITMPSSMSKERIALMKALGAEVVLTDAAKGMSGAIEKAEELQKEISSSIIAGQFINPANPEAHYKTTGPEIWQDTDGKIDFLICGVGTGGTITGTGKYLKNKNRNIKVFAVEPYNSSVLSGMDSGKHGIMGIGAGFVPKVLDTKIYDEILRITNDKAYEFARLAARCDGVLCGISSGAALAAAYEIMSRPENKGKTAVVILPDGVERYLSTPLFE